MACAAWAAPRRQKTAQAEAYATEGRFGKLEFDAFAGLVATVPQSLDGAAAMLAYVGECLAEGDALYDEDETFTLLASVECAICKAAGLPMPAAWAEPG